MSQPLAEFVARLFHENYERLAPDYEHKTNPETSKPFDELPPSRKGLMIATSGEVLEHLKLLGLHARFDNDGAFVAVTESGERILSRPVKPPPPSPPIALPPAPPPRRTSIPLEPQTPVPLLVARAEKRNTARTQGYTGDLCDNCNGSRMKRNGSCLCCEDCGTTTGCS